MEENLYLDPNELKSFKIKRTILNIVMYTFLVLMALFIVIPFYWMIISSFKSTAEITQELTFFPKHFEFKNYAIIFNPEKYGETLTIKLGWMFLNTIIVGTITTFGTVVTSVLAAFAFSRLNWKGREAVFSILLATMMIPGEIFVLTNYQTLGGLVRSTSRLDTYVILILPFITSVFYTFYLRQTFKQIPNELYLAAKVDGTSDLKYLLKVMVPIAQATITTVIILSMIGSWNAFVWPKLVTKDIPEFYLISNGLSQAFSGKTAQSGPNSILNLQMAASTIVSAPLLVVFFSFKKYILRGVSRSGIKG